MKKTLLATFLSCFLSVTSLYAEFNLLPNVQEPRLEFGYAVGDFITIDRNYAEIGLFVPATFDDWQPFFDIEGYRFDNGRWAASTGVGLRRIICDNTVVGANVYYDYRESNFKNHFNQIGVGVEWLTSCWDFRLNTYFPFSQKESGHGCKFDLGDGFFASNHRDSFAYTGFDAEIGTPLTSFCGFDLYGAVGPYYYKNRHRHHNGFWGGFARLELDWMTIFTVTLQASHDKVYHTNVQGIFEVSIPFDFFCFNSCNEGCGCNCNIIQPIVRNNLIQIDDCCSWKWNWDDRVR